MPTSRHQTLFAAVLERLRTITTAGGYDTNAGMRVYPWRDTKNSPFKQEELADDGAMVLRDPRKVTEQGGPNVLGKHHHTLTINIEGAVKEGTAADRVRAITADIEKAIGVDRKWSAIAYETTPGDMQILVAENGTTITGYSLTFSIEFRTGNWDPFNA